MFTYLCDYQVPVLRATWFIKLSSAYTVAVSEQKIKKRQLPDPAQGSEMCSPRFAKWLRLNVNNFRDFFSSLFRMDKYVIKVYERTTYKIARILPKSKSGYECFRGSGHPWRVDPGGRAEKCDETVAVLHVVSETHVSGKS